jgi:hypothetical protein
MRLLFSKERLMQDVALPWGGDLTIGAAGDLLLVQAGALSQQRVLRRLLTNQNDYVWQPDYGAGLGQFVGATNAVQPAAGLVHAQILLEASVAPQPIPVVQAQTRSDNTLVMTIEYALAHSGATQSLSFSMST